MENKTHTRTIKGRGVKYQAPQSSEATHQKALAIAERSRHLVTVAEQVAQDKFCYKNWLVLEARAYWPQAPIMWHVEFMYPYAKGGKLLVDQPRTEDEKRECQVKGDRLKAWGYRYVVVTEGMTLEEALMQLGEE